MPDTARLRRRARYYRSVGVTRFVQDARRRVLGTNSRIARSIDRFAGVGVEVGGPSSFFAHKGWVPVYDVAARIDNVVFSTRTRWEGDVVDGGTFSFRRGAAPGRQMVAEGHRIDARDGTYDFVLSSHMLEHTANPVRALREFHRVVRAGGALLLVMPDPRHTFDHRRPTTPLQHLLEDADRDMAEDDETHFAEVLELHDLARDPEQVSADQFRRWVLANAVNRGVHHHVFDESTAKGLLAHCGFDVEMVEHLAPHHLCLLASARVTS